MTQKKTPGALVDCQWLQAHRDDPDVVVVEIAGMGQEQRQAYTAGLASELTLIQADSAELAQHLKDVDLQARARGMLRDQVALLAVTGAEKILRREIDAKAHADLLNVIKQQL